MAIDDEGFARLPGLIDGRAVVQLREQVARRLRRPLDGACERPHNRLVPLRFDAPLVDAADLRPSHPALADLPGQRTLAARAGDAAVLDYRLLHGTHPNARAARRDALLLTFTPDWGGLPADIRGHLIDHPALPARADRAARAGWQRRFLPTFDGPRGTIDLDRDAPATFAFA